MGETKNKMSCEDCKKFQQAVKVLVEAGKEFIAFSELRETVSRGDYIKYQVKAIGGMREALSNPAVIEASRE